VFLAGKTLFLRSRDDFATAHQRRCGITIVRCGSASRQ
jgi:hypothetical protein